MAIAISFPMKRANHHWAWVLGLGGGLIGCATSPERVPRTPTTAPFVRYPGYGPLEKRFQEARGQNVPLLSPGLFESARSTFEDARRSVQAGKDPVETGEKVGQAREALLKAFTQADGTREILADVLEARQESIRIQESSENPLHRKDREKTFREGEARFRDLAELMEAGSLQEALARRAGVLRLYLDSRGNVDATQTLAAARRLFEQARARGAAEVAPINFSVAQANLQGAERFAQIHPGAYNELPRRAKEAHFYAERLRREMGFAEQSRTASLVKSRGLPPLPSVTLAE